MRRAASHGPAVETVIVALDGSEEARAALPIAHVLAEATGALLHVLHVAEAPLDPETALLRIGVHRAELRTAVLDTELGDPAERLVQHAGRMRARFLVLTTHGRAVPAAPERALGPIAEATLVQAGCPIVFVRPRQAAHARLHRILVPFDGTPGAAAALGFAIELARGTPATIEILHVAQAGEAPRRPEERVAPRYVDQPQHEWTWWRRDLARRVADRAGVPADRLVARLLGEEDSVAEAILRAAEVMDADLIVLAVTSALARRGEEGRALVVRRVLAVAPCPVLLLRRSEG